jgi:Tol biopolymer transport system component
LVLGLILAAGIVVIVWALGHHSSRRSELIERKLTANSSENRIRSMAISPNGQHLAYGDNTGIFLKLIQGGETHPIPLPPNFFAEVDDWFSDGDHLLVSRTEQPGKVSLWSVSVFGGSPRRLADEASGGSLSPDGSHIAFRRGQPTYDGLWGQEEWVMRPDGTDQVKVASGSSDASQMGTPTWSPDGKRIA